MGNRYGRTHTGCAEKLKNASHACRLTSKALAANDAMAASACSKAASLIFERLAPSPALPLDPSGVLAAAVKLGPGIGPQQTVCPEIGRHEANRRRFFLQQEQKMGERDDIAVPVRSRVVRDHDDGRARPS
jgi:hypothetical protein